MMAHGDVMILVNLLVFGGGFVLFVIWQVILYYWRKWKSDRAYIARMQAERKKEMDK